MINRTLKDYSATDKRFKIKDVLKEQIKHVLEKEVYSDPFICWFSIGQLQWGNGYHFKNMPGSFVSKRQLWLDPGPQAVV
jgi:hypothetical protein